jgi:hypothetical protein
MTMRQGKASAGSLKSEWTDRYTYCTPQEARLSIFESMEGYCQLGNVAM